MRKKLLFILLVAGMAFASSSDLGHRDGAAMPTQSPANPGEFPVDNPYDYGALTNGLACYSANGWYLANDFEVDYVGDVCDYCIWIIDNGTASSIDSMFYDGDASGPGSLLGVQSGVGTLTDTGDDNWGYDLYECVVALDADYVITAQYYWMSFDPVGGFYYWLTPDHDGTWGAEAYFSEDGGYSWSDSTTMWGTAYDNFWVIWPAWAIEEITWGQIKAEF